jgi:aspartate/methionine/tyrosine aminotransferase
MYIAPFAIEQYFARYEFTTPHSLCASDCETIEIAELLELAGSSLTELGKMRLGYTESQGHPDLRRAVSQTYTTVRPDDIIILTTPEEGIYLTMRTLLEPDDHAVVLTPAYDSLLNMAQHVSGNVSRWTIQASETGWQLDLEQLEQLVMSRTKLIVVNFPHNPTGLLPSENEFRTIIEIARKHNAWLFWDEMYRGLEHSGSKTQPSAADMYHRCIVLAGLSKVHGLPGLRSGWLVVKDSEIRAGLINWKHYTSICPPAPSEFLAMAALQAKDHLVARNRTIIERNLATAAQFFARWPEMFEWRPPQAGSIALVGLNQPSATEYCHDLARDAGVLLLPSSCMGYGDKHVRFGFGRVDFAHNLEHYESYLVAESE